MAGESSEDLIQKQWERRGYFGVHSQKQEGFRLLATLTAEQNIIIPNIENSKIEALLKDLLLKDSFSPERPLLMKVLVQVADFGFLGCMARDENGKVCEGADVYVGARVGSDSLLRELYKKSVPCKDLVPLVVDILVKHFGAVPREREDVED
ncbi:hypothetical protein Peur_036142 [Populus x canadensis]